MLNKKIIAIALTCAVTAGATGVVAAAYTKNNQEAITSAAAEQAASETEQSNNEKADTPVEIAAQNDVSTEKQVNDSETETSAEIPAADETEKLPDDKVDISNEKEIDEKLYEVSEVEVVEEEMFLSPEQEQQLEALCREADDIISNHEELWNKVYDKMYEQLDASISAGDIVTYNEYEYEDETGIHVYNIPENPDTEENNTEDDSEEAYFWYSNSETDADGSISIIERNEDGVIMDEETTIQNMDELTDEEKELLLNDLKQLNEIYEKIDAIYAQAENE